MTHFADTAADSFGARFAAELLRLTDGALTAQQVHTLTGSTRFQIIRAVRARLTWLSSEALALLAERGPEELARGLAREEAREEDRKRPVGDCPSWLAGLLDLLSVAGSMV